MVARGVVAAGLQTQVCPGWGALRHGGAVLGPLISARAGLVRRAGIDLTASACVVEDWLVASALYLLLLSVCYLWCCTMYIVLRRPVCQKSCIEAPLLTRVAIEARETGGPQEAGGKEARIAGCQTTSVDSLAHASTPLQAPV